MKCQYLRAKRELSGGGVGQAGGLAVALTHAHGSGGALQVAVVGAVRALASTHGGDDAVQTAALVEGDEGGAAGTLDIHGQGVAAVVVVRAGADRAVGYVCSFHFDSFAPGRRRKQRLLN